MPRRSRRHRRWHPPPSTRRARRAAHRRAPTNAASSPSTDTDKISRPAASSGTVSASTSSTTSHRHVPGQPIRRRVVGQRDVVEITSMSDEPSPGIQLVTDAECRFDRFDRPARDSSWMASSSRLPASVTVRSTRPVEGAVGSVAASSTADVASVAAAGSARRATPPGDPSEHATTSPMPTNRSAATRWGPAGCTARTVPATRRDTSRAAPLDESHTPSRLRKALSSTTASRSIFWQHHLAEQER